MNYSSIAIQLENLRHYYPNVLDDNDKKTRFRSRVCTRSVLIYFCFGRQKRDSRRTRLCLCVVCTRRGETGAYFSFGRRYFDFQNRKKFRGNKEMQIIKKKKHVSFVKFFPTVYANGNKTKIPRKCVKTL